VDKLGIRTTVSADSDICAGSNQVVPMLVPIPHVPKIGSHPFLEKVSLLGTTVENYGYRGKCGGKCGGTLTNSCVWQIGVPILFPFEYFSHIAFLNVLPYSMLYYFDNNNVHICKSHECHPKYGRDTY